ncbi:hypothetical protein [Agrobacterium sp. CG674]
MPTISPLPTRHVFARHGRGREAGGWTQTCGQASECDDMTGWLDHLDPKDHSRLSVAGQDGLPDAPQKLGDRIIHDPVSSNSGRPTQMRHYLQYLGLDTYRICVASPG